MLKRNIVYSKASFGFGINPDVHNDSQARFMVPSLSHCRREEKSCSMRATFPVIGASRLDFVKEGHIFQLGKMKGVADENAAELSEEDDDLCPVECVREFKTDEEFLRILEKAKERSSLVVVDFYRTSCGSCKYIERGFSSAEGAVDFSGEGGGEGVGVGIRVSFINTFTFFLGFGGVVTTFLIDLVVFTCGELGMVNFFFGTGGGMVLVVVVVVFGLVDCLVVREGAALVGAFLVLAAVVFLAKTPAAVGGGASTSREAANSPSNPV